MITKKEQAYAYPIHNNHITNTARKLRDVSKKMLEMFNENNTIHKVGVVGNQLEFTFDDLEEFYKESEGCHVYLERLENQDYPYKAHFVLYNTRFAVELDNSDLSLFKRLFAPDEYTDLIGKDIYSMTVGELESIGASVHVNFHMVDCRDKAQNKIDQFDQFGEIEYHDGESSNWIEMRGDNVSVTAFYLKGGNQNETK